MPGLFFPISTAHIPLASPATMYVKSEPDCDFDINMEMMTDMETHLLREELFGNSCIPSGRCWCAHMSIFPPPSRPSL